MTALSSRAEANRVHHGGVLLFEAGAIHRQGHVTLFVDQLSRLDISSPCMHLDAGRNRRKNPNWHPLAGYLVHPHAPKERGCQTWISIVEFRAAIESGYRFAKDLNAGRAG